MALPAWGVMPARTRDGLAKGLSMTEMCVASLDHVASDGVVLHVDRYHRGASPQSIHVLVVHGYLEHGRRYERFARALDAQGISCSVMELRGHGRSQGCRAHVDQFSRYVDDVVEILAALAIPRESTSSFVFGHSLGGLIVSHFAQRHGKDVSGVLLSNPYLANAVPIPLAKQWLGRLTYRVAPRLRAPAGLKREWMSRDPAALDAMANDRDIQRFATAGWFHEVTLAQQAASAFHRWDCPVWFGLGDADPVASPAAGRRLAEQLTAPAKCVRIYPNALHELLQDVMAEEVQDDIAHWLNAKSGVSTSA